MNSQPTNQPPEAVSPINEMDKAIRCLALELPAEVWEDVNKRWQRVKATPPATVIPPLPSIPDWIINYDKAGHQSSAGKAIRFLMEKVGQLENPSIPPNQLSGREVEEMVGGTTADSKNSKNVFNGNILETNISNNDVTFLTNQLINEFYELYRKFEKDPDEDETPYNRGFRIGTNITYANVVFRMKELLKAGYAASPQLSRREVERVCQNCNGKNPTWYADNELFNKVNGSPNGIICPSCFEKKADQMGINIIFKAGYAASEGEEAIGFGEFLRKLEPQQNLISNQDGKWCIIWDGENKMATTDELFKIYDKLKPKHK